MATIITDPAVVDRGLRDPGDRLMTLKTPLARVRGLGSAKDGVGHWWWQRMTAIALVPLGIWFVLSVISISSM